MSLYLVKTEIKDIDLEKYTLSYAGSFYHLSEDPPRGN